MQDCCEIIPFSLFSLLRDGGVAAVAAPPAHRERGNDKGHCREHYVVERKGELGGGVIKALKVVVYHYVTHHGSEYTRHAKHRQPVIPTVKLHRVNHIVIEGSHTP